jgi:hypothetical protein
LEASAVRIASFNVENLFDCAAVMKTGSIFRLGAWGGKNGTLWDHDPSLKSKVLAASDHCAIYADLNL